eukprot:527250_1
MDENTYNPQPALNHRHWQSILKNLNLPVSSDDDDDDDESSSVLRSISIRKKVDYTNKKINVYWSYPSEKFIDEYSITFKIIYNNTEHITLLLPYSFPFSALPISFKVKTICTMKESKKSHKNEQKLQHKTQLLIGGYIRHIIGIESISIKNISVMIFHFSPLFMNIRISDDSETIIIQSIQCIESKTYNDNINIYECKWSESHIYTTLQLKQLKSHKSYIYQYNENMLKLSQPSNNKQQTCCFVLDHIFNSHIHTQKDIFEKIGKPLMNTALKGYNVSLITFGPSGSGKRTSMFGSDIFNTDTFDGLMPRSVEYIFDILSSEIINGIIKTFYVSISMFMICGTTIVDLLMNSSHNHIKSSDNISVFLSNLTDIDVDSEKSAVNELMKGFRNGIIFGQGSLKRMLIRSNVFVILNLKKTLENKYKYCSISRILFGELAATEYTYIDRDSGILQLTQYAADIKSNKKQYDHPLLFVLKDALSGHSKTTFLNCINRCLIMEPLQLAQNIFNEVTNKSRVKFVEKIKEANPYYFMQLKSVNDKNFKILVSVNTISDKTQTLFVKAIESKNDDEIYSISIENGKRVTSLDIDRKECDEFEIYKFVLYDSKSAENPLPNSCSMIECKIWNKISKPNVIDTLSVSKIINKQTNEINIYWATPPQSFGEISYKITQNNNEIEDEKNEEQSIFLLPYTIALSALPISFRVTTICKVNNLIYQSDKSEYVAIGFMVINGNKALFNCN